MLRGPSPSQDARPKKPHQRFRQFGYSPGCTFGPARDGAPPDTGKWRPTRRDMNRHQIPGPAPHQMGSLRGTRACGFDPREYRYSTVKFDSLFRGEDANPARIWSHFMIVKLHATRLATAPYETIGRMRRLLPSSSTLASSSAKPHVGEAVDKAAGEAHGSSSGAAICALTLMSTRPN